VQREVCSVSHIKNDALYEVAVEGRDKETLIRDIEGYLAARKADFQQC
jgi:hypothetical protein